jgi:hypothetical protein
MKTLPQHPYLQNIVAEYRRQRGLTPKSVWDPKDYVSWLGQFGFLVPMDFDKLVFPDDFSDQDLMLFVLRWS